ncbi:MAG: non-heme iron oxygenase ferredoxin subunit [Verrucomicrobiae bacterium]|nr:non-heme iron oxygenase ferredoxin subunit [Verrucomicrobiae bacterium]
MSRWITVANVNELPPGRRKIVEVEGKKIGLIRTADGAFHAIEDRCTHDDGPLAEGELDGDAIVCPRHGARFNLATGKALTLPAFGFTGRWPVRVEDDKVQLEFE